MEAERKVQEPGAGARLAIDLGPLVVFFAANAWRGIFAATIAFMVAMVASMLISQLKYRHISPWSWFPAVLAAGSGGATAWRWEGQTPDSQQLARSSYAAFCLKKKRIY